MGAHGSHGQGGMRDGVFSQPSTLDSEPLNTHGSHGQGRMRDGAVDRTTFANASMLPRAGLMLPVCVKKSAHCIDTYSLENGG